MRIRRKLLELARVVAEEAEHDSGFAQKLGEVLGLERSQRDKKGTKSDRPRNRRAAAAFDPVAVLRDRDDHELRARLSGLNLEQLRDIVAQYGMDPGKLVMKWKTLGRVVNRIVEISTNRAQKGDAFRLDVRGSTELEQPADRPLEDRRKAEPIE